MNLSATAEGVETQGSWAFIKDVGVDYFQGYLLSRPICSEEAIKYMKHGLSFIEDHMQDNLKQPSTDNIHHYR